MLLKVNCAWKYLRLSRKTKTLTSFFFVFDGIRYEKYRKYRSNSARTGIDILSYISTVTDRKNLTVLIDIEKKSKT
jgi:hypothetical protein